MVRRHFAGSGLSQDHQAILDLLAAFGFDTKGSTSVTIHAAIGEATTVQITRQVLPSAVTASLVQQTYEVTAKEIDTR